MRFGDGEGVDWSFDDVRGIVGTPDAFYYDPRHAVIYRVLLETHDAGEPIDMVVMSDRLAKLDNPPVEDEYLIELAERFGAPSATLIAGGILAAALIALTLRFRGIWQVQ